MSERARIAVVLSLALLALPAQAQVWSGAGVDNNWGTAGNWIGGVPPASSPATAVSFSGSASSFLPFLNGGWTINSMGITSPGYNFSGGALSFGGTNPALTVTSPGCSIANQVNLLTNLTLDNAASFELSGGLAGAGNLQKTGVGTLLVTGNTWHNGSTTVAAGTLQIGDGTIGPTTVRSIVNAGAVLFDFPFGSITVNGSITGSGAVTITTDTLVRNVSLSPIAHQGPTFIDGDLDLLNGSMASNGPVLIGPAGAFFMSTSAAVGSIAGSGELHVNGSATTLTAGGDDSSTTFTGNIGGAGGFRKAGAGTFTLATNSTFLGGLTVDAPGTMRLGNGTIGPGVVPGSLVVDGTLVFDKSGGFTVTGPVTGSGDILIESGTSVSHASVAPFMHQGSTTIHGMFLGGNPTIDNNGPLLIGPTGQFQMQNGTVGSLSGSGALTVNAGTLTAGGDNSSTTFSGFISGGGHFRKVGNGTLTLTGPGSFNGDMSVEAPGTVRIGNGSTGPGAVQALTINGTMIFDVPSVTLQGPVTGTGSLRVEAGTTLFNGTTTALSHQGATTVHGTLNLGGAAPNSIDNNGPLVISPSGILFARSGLVGSLAGSGAINLLSGIFIVGGDDTSTTYSGTISGPAELRKTGAGTFTVASPSWFGGDVTIEAPGTIRVGNGATGPLSVNSIVVDGTLLFNTPSIPVNGTITGGGNVTVQSGSTVFLSTAMTHSGTTIVSGQLNGNPGFAAVDNNAPLILSGGLFTRGGNVGSLSGSGSLQLIPGGTFTTGGNDVASSFAGALSGPGGFTKVGSNTLTLSGASPSFTGLVQVASGTVHLSGTLATSGTTVVTGAALTGIGTHLGPLNVEIAATLAPGPTVATLTTGNLALAGTLQLDVLGTAPGTQHDSLNVNGTVALNGGTLALSGAYVPTTGNTFVIINNDGGDPVTGTFAGLAEGATFSFNGASLRISYMGGTGNDVVLSLANFTVTPSAGANGTINPATPQGVAPGATTTFTVTPNSGFSASVGGTCGGNLVGTTYTTNAVNSDCTVVASFVVASFTVTPSAGANGSINPSTPQVVAPGATTTFTVTPNSGFTASVGGTCGGNLVGTTYTTNAINANCTVIASFAVANFTVTPSAGANGTINPATPQGVAAGATTTFTVTANTGFTASVGGTCGGNLVGTTYTTNAVNADCTVVASFAAVSYTVTPSAGANGAITPSAPQTVPHGSTATFTVSPAPGYIATVGGTCGGALAGTTYLTNPITANCTVSATFASGNPARLLNISTRMQVLTGNDVMIGGFIIGGSAAKTVVVRARGPSLVPLGLPNAISNPQLQLFSGQTEIGYNNNWQDASNFAQLQASGFAPADPLESALLVTLPPGAYTAMISGVGGDTGIAIVEVFEIDAASSPLVNISTRGHVGVANNVMIAGLIIEGTDPQQIVVRARGPSLAALGVTGGLADPALVLTQSSDGTVLGVSDNWGSATNAAALQASGFAPSDPAEAALLVTLHPGAYTVTLTGVGNTTGVAIVEIFAVP